MRTLAILGAGDLGGAVASHAALRGVARRIVLVDEAASVAEGKALDIAQSMPIEGIATDVRGTGDLRAVADASMVVLADRYRAGAAAEEWDGDAGLALLREVWRLAPRAVVICAGARQLALVEVAACQPGTDRRRVLGSAPEALRAAAVALTAREAGTVPSDIALALVGRPPASIIVPWDEVSLAGRPAVSVLAAGVLARLDARLVTLWPPGPLALGAAASRVVASALADVPHTVSAYVVPSPLDVPRTRGIALPVTLGPSGLGPIALPALSPRDRVRLDTALDR